MSNLYRVVVKEPGPGDSSYYTIIVEHATYGEHLTNISAITEAAESISHCDILHIVAGFSQGILFDYDSVCDFLDLYAPDPKSAIQWLDHPTGIVIRPSLESIFLMG